LNGGCGDATATGTITVTLVKTVSEASSTPTVCSNTDLTPITHATTGATGIGTPTGLPTGVTAVWANDIVTISGTPTADGTFAYSIPLIGGCGAVNATGTISVTPEITVAEASSTPTLCINTELTAITHATTGATGIGIATGLPDGVTASWADDLITISGTPNLDGTFDYTIPLNGGCGAATATGTIVVTPGNAFEGLASSYCNSAESAVLTGFPAGGSFSISPSIPGAIAGNVLAPSLLPAGSYDVTYTVGLPFSVCNETVIQTVLIVEAPTVTIDPIVPAVCSQDAPLALSGSPSTGVFSGNGVVGSTFDPTLTGSGTQTITYTVTDAGNVCSGSATTSIEVNAVPVVTISGVSGDYCLNSDPVTMIGLPESGSFSIDGVASGESFDPSVLGLGSHTLRYEFNNGTCIGYDEITVNVVSDLTLAIDNLPSVVCSNSDPIELTSTPAGAIFSGQGVTGGNTFDPSQVTVGSTSITATYSNGNCSATTSQAVVVNAAPSASFTYITDGSSVAFSNTSSNATGYSWNFGDASAQSIAMNPTHNYQESGSYTVELIATSESCGTDTFSVQLDYALGIESIHGIDMIQLYPNPTNGYVTLSFNSLQPQTFEVRIADASGRLLQMEALTNHIGKYSRVYDLSDKAQGVYMFTVSSERGSVNIRVVNQ
jgi:hypothetical protein